MEWYKSVLDIPTGGKGLFAFTEKVAQQITSWEIQEGMCFLFLQHTSASLTISESYDPSAKQDIAEFFERLVPESQPWMQHTLEGKDDSSSHLRSVLTQVDLCIPIENGRLALGAWQGIYVFEHRAGHQKRHVLLRCLKIE